MQNKTYAELFDLISGLAGVSDFAAEEEAYILGFVNRRLYQAYRTNEAWPRYVIGPQARPATDGIIARTFTPTSQNIVSATRNGTTVTATLAAAPNFVAGMSVTIASLSGTVSPNGVQVVTSVSNLSFTFELASGTGTETYTGSGTVQAVAVPNIDSFGRVWDGNPYGTTSAYEYDFWTDFNGAHVINPRSGELGFWIVGVKEWDGPYTDTATNIPQEFFQWAAHASYADYLRLDRQNDKAATEEAIAQQFLVLELDKAQQQGNNRLTWRISTHLSRQAR
jgi:hypothetical protein